MNWKQLGACRTHPEIDFFPEPKDGRWASVPARECCSACPVRAQCLDAALTRDEKGIWGGTNETERQWIKDRSVRARYINALANGRAVRVGM